MSYRSLCSQLFAVKEVCFRAIIDLDPDDPDLSNLILLVRMVAESPDTTYFCERIMMKPRALEVLYAIGWKLNSRENILTLHGNAYVASKLALKLLEFYQSSSFHKDLNFKKSAQVLVFKPVGTALLRIHHQDHQGHFVLAYNYRSKSPKQVIIDFDIFGLRFFWKHEDGLTIFRESLDEILNYFKGIEGIKLEFLSR